jgi:hypothetical protein
MSYGMTTAATHERLERVRRRQAARSLRGSAFQRVPVPSVGWLSRPSALRGVASLVDIRGGWLKIDHRRFAAAADGIALSQDFTTVALDLRLAVDTVTTDPAQQPSRPPGSSRSSGGPLPARTSRP